MLQGTPEFAQMYSPIARSVIRLVDNYAERYIVLSDQHTFCTLFAAMGLLYGVEKSLSDKAEMQRPELKDQESYRKMFREMERDLGHGVTSKYVSMYLLGSSVHYQLEENEAKLEKLLSFWEKQVEKIEAGGYITSLDVNLEHLSTVLPMTLAEKRLLEHAVLSGDVYFSRFLQMMGRYSSVNDKMLLRLLCDHTINETDLEFALSRDSILAKSGILTYNQRLKRLNFDDFWADVLTKNHADVKSFFTHFVTPLKRKENAGSLARFAEADSIVINKILDNTILNDGDTTGFNILAYGPTTIDKRSLVHDLIEERQLRGWVANTKRNPRSAPSICYVAQRWIEAMHPDHVLVIEDAADVLKRNNTSLFHVFGFDENNEVKANETEDRKELDEHVLLDNPAVTFWFVNTPHTLSQDNLGRFIYHCEIKPASRKARKEGIERAITKLDIPVELAQDLSKYSELSEQQVKSAAKLAELLTDDVEERKSVLTSAIDRSQRAFGRNSTEELRAVVTKYSTKYLNLDGQFTPEQIIQSLRRRQSGTLCFWGIPGTGKTQLAEHMAVELDLPIIKKRGSDLLDKYVGGNEQNIAAMFAEARDENGILLLDEADSFLRDRSLAKSSWEVSMVNELLQQMEMFKGIFICATNLFEQLDAASLRRFTFKLEFRALLEEARWEMFLNETGLNVEETAPEVLEEHRERVAAIEYLTPGDFATVKRQMLILDGSLTPEQWIMQLESEAKTKLAGITRNKIGFTG